MTPELDLDGPAAPPRSNGELSFEHPWQGRLFANTMALCDVGLIDYATFRERLIAEIAVHDRRPDDPGEYWSAWQDALEALVTGIGLCDRDDIERRAIEFAAHD
jgi:nitrile hydratase accessory protein